MKNACPSGCVAADVLALAGRWALGGFFIYMGLNKAADPVAFLKLVRQYDLFPTPLLLNGVAALLPWFEVFCGALLIAGIAVRGAALVVAALLVPFSLAILGRALDLGSAQGIPLCAVKFDCGCGTGEVNACRKLVENTLWTALALWLAWSRHGRRWCLHPELWGGR